MLRLHGRPSESPKMTLYVSIGNGKLAALDKLGLRFVVERAHVCARVRASPAAPTSALLTFAGCLVPRIDASTSK